MVKIKKVSDKMITINKNIQSEILMTTMEEIVPQDSLFRKIDKYIDFTFIYDKVKDLYCENNGRPSIDPVVLFKIVFIQALDGIKSMRQTCKKIKVDAEYRWFLGIPFWQDTPHFSTFSKNYERRFKDSDIFEEIFVEIVNQAIKYNLVDGNTFYTDSTHKKANANKNKYDDEIVKVHVHTNQPGEAFTRALTYGSLSRMKIDNMREEHHERLIKNAQKMAEQQKAEEEKQAANEPKKKYGFIAVSVGNGLDEIFKGLNVDYIISGGQTMNPSTEDILNAVDKVNAETIFVLPNNKNIILAANQAVDLVENKTLSVIPSKTIPQGIAAMIGFVDDMSVEENKEAMIDSMSYVKTGEVTYAVRDTVIDDKEIKEGNIMGIGDEGMLAVGEKIADTTVEMIKEMQDEDSEIVSIYYGEGITKDDADALVEKISDELPDLEVEVYEGGQPVYYYIVSVE